MLRHFLGIAGESPGWKPAPTEPVGEHVEIAIQMMKCGLHNEAGQMRQPAAGAENILLEEVDNRGVNQGLGSGFLGGRPALRIWSPAQSKICQEKFIGNVLAESQPLQEKAQE